MLIAQVPESDRIFLPLERKRAYIRLGEGAGYSDSTKIIKEAFERTLIALNDFLSAIREHDAEKVKAVATGITREAVNGKEFIYYIREHTGIKVEIITGREEAVLTAKGVRYSSDIGGPDPLIFDLGGGSTEFISGPMDSPILKSVPLGAWGLTRNYLEPDPPGPTQLAACAGYVDKILKTAFVDADTGERERQVIGTGGTVVTLAAMCNEIPVEAIDPEKITGLRLQKDELGDLFNRVKGLAMDERCRIKGLDPERADVILGGFLAVIRIMEFLKTKELVVSMSDILEGLLVDCLEGE
jgi:exopolyphosphatase/guanosine-5'-triphosphate,3'-diphosphate pyrophosphatase